MATKLDHLQKKKLNPADELRETLSFLEEQQPRLKTLSKDDALALLRAFDKVDDLITVLEAGGVNLLSERGRFDTLEGQLNKKAGLVVKAIGGSAAFVAQRPQPAPAPEERWWWYLDELMAARKKKNTWQLAVGSGLLALIFLIVYVLFQTVLAPSPEVVARMQAENDSMLGFNDGDYAAALAALETGLATAGADPRLLMMKGVFLELQNQPDAAQASFEQAEKLLNNAEAYHLLRAQIYLSTNQPAIAEHDARAVVESNPDSSQGWLMLGQSLEGQNQIPEAIEAFERAGDLAVANGDNEIVVLARLAVARLIGAGL